MRIDEKLNLVVPVRGDDEEPRCFAFHVPISREVFETHFRALSLMHAEIVGRDSSYMGAGIRCASLIFRDISASEAAKRGPQGADRSAALLGEIKRLTTILAPQDRHWETMPVDVAISAGQLSADEWSEVESALVFFTGAYWMASASKRNDLTLAIASMIGSSTTLLQPLAFADGLPASKMAPRIMTEVSSVPS